MMEKPDITEGIWKEVAPNAVGSITIEEDICYVANTKNDNIRAISAVPDMIHALIKAYRISGLWLPDMATVPPEHYGEAEALANMYSDIEKALKKAGVKFETEPQTS